MSCKVIIAFCFQLQLPVIISQNKENREDRNRVRSEEMQKRENKEKAPHKIMFSLLHTRMPRPLSELVKMNFSCPESGTSPIYKINVRAIKKPSRGTVRVVHSFGVDSWDYLWFLSKENPTNVSMTILFYYEQAIFFSFSFFEYIL